MNSNRSLPRDDSGLHAISRIEVRADQDVNAEFVNVKLTGKSLLLGKANPELPIVAELSLDPDAPASLQCGETAFGSGPARPRCDLIGNGTRILCH